MLDESLRVGAGYSSVLILTDEELSLPTSYCSLISRSSTGSPVPPPPPSFTEI